MSLQTLLPLMVVLLPVLGLIAALAPRAGYRLPDGVLALAPGVLFVAMLIGAGPVLAGQVVQSHWPWAVELGLSWDVWVTPLGLLLGLLICGIGTLIVIYAGAYLKGSADRDRFFGVLFLFMAAMLGIAFTENLLVLFIFWELTSIASYMLIGFYHAKTESRKSALDALLITGGGGLALLAGFILLGEIGGTYRISELIAARQSILADPLYPAVLVCVLVGALTKSAQVPFHFWLPGAMAAPAPVSAYLHSATMVKAGVFLLAILHPVLGGTDQWHMSVMSIGALTMTWGALIGAMQTDLKRVLAFSTVSALGTLIMLLGIENTLAAKAAVVFLIVHALYKASLFMVVGVLEKTTGIRDVTELRGLFGAMPLVAVAAALAAASMSGLPPFVGFIAKELLYEVKLQTPIFGISLLICGLIANAANIVVALNAGISPFLKRSAQPTPIKKKPSWLLALGPLVLGLGSLVAGLFPQSLGPMVSAAASQIQMQPIEVKLKLWHGFNLVLLLSAATVVLGLIGYTLRRRLWSAGLWLNDDLKLSGQSAFRQSLSATIRMAGWITRVFPSGDLVRYFLAIGLAIIASLIGAWWTTGYRLEFNSTSPWRIEALVVCALIIAATLALLRAKSRMLAVLLLGCVGFGISALFAVYGAPDLAITQLLVETLTLVLFSLAIYGLPRLEAPRRATSQRWICGIVAVALGICFFMLTLKAMEVQWDEPIARQIAQRSLSEAHGRNIVNVILVDFRALDTLGEISVLLIAALGVAAMLNRTTARPRAIARQSSRSPVLAASARYTAPAMIAMSIYLLLRGHNEPGGGFIGGLVAAMASVLVHLADPARPLRLMRLRPETLAGWGLLIAGASGLPGLLWRDSFMAAVWGPSIWLPLLGKVKLGTPLVFDIGVYAVVGGIVLLLYGRLQSWHADRLDRRAMATGGVN